MIRLRKMIPAVLVVGLVVAWGPYAYCSYWWIRLGVDEGYRGEVFGPLSYFRPRFFWAGVILSAATVCFLLFKILQRNNRPVGRAVPDTVGE